MQIAKDKLLQSKRDFITNDNRILYIKIIQKLVKENQNINIKVIIICKIIDLIEINRYNISDINLGLLSDQLCKTNIINTKIKFSNVIDSLFNNLINNITAATPAQELENINKFIYGSLNILFKYGSLNVLFK